MQKLPTAEELMTNVANEHSYETWGEMMYDTHEHSQIEYTREVMIEFVKLHVQAALESAAEKLPYDDKLNQDMLVKESILNAYPLDNIK